MKSSNHKRTLIITLLLATVFLISCGNKDNYISKDSVSKTTSLDFRITWKAYSGRGEAVQKIVDTYNKNESDSFQISVVGGDEDITSIEGLLGKNDSESIYVLPYRFVKYFGDKGYLADLSTSFIGEKDLFDPELWKLGSVNGVTYGIPWLGHSICLIYNKNLLEKAGVDGASINSLDSLVKAMETVEANTGVKGIGLVGANHNDVSWMVNQFIYGYGSYLVNEDGTKVTINNEQSKMAIDFYKNVLGKYAQPSWVDDTGVEVIDYFRKQQIAFEFQGVWGVTDIEKNGKPFEVGVIPLDNIGLSPEVGPMMLAIPKSMSVEKKDEAKKFIRFMISKEAQEKIMDGEYSPEHDAYYPFRTPVRKDISEGIISKNYPQYLPFSIGFKKPSIDVPVSKWQTIKDEYYAPGLHQVMKAEITIDEFLNMIELKGNEILSEK